MAEKGKQPRKAAKSFGEFASTFAQELNDLSGGMGRGSKTSFSNSKQADVNLAQKKKKKAYGSSY